jgi:uncharacterized membrane protein
MKPFGLKAVLWGLGLASALAVRGVKRKSLTKQGAVAAFLVGLCSISSGWRSGLLLVLFYQTGSMATKHRKPLKETMDATAATASSRGPSQVLGCSLLATLCALAHSIWCGEEQVISFNGDHDDGESRLSMLLSNRLACAIVAHYACCCADTLASELGMLSTLSPRLVTSPWRTVPRGTNGGVSLWGTVCSALGGCLMGLVCFFTDTTGTTTTTMTNIAYAYQCLLYGGICGVVGSFFDSLLGATCQASYFDKDTKLVYSTQDHDVAVPPTAQHTCGHDLLSNVQVNIVSTLLTMMLGAFVIGPRIFI